MQLGQILSVFVQEFLILTEGSKSFGTHLRENNLGTLLALFYGWAWDQIGQKFQYLAKKKSILGQIWPFMGQKSNFWGGGRKTFGTLISVVQWDTFFVLKTLIGDAPIDR